MYGISNQFGVSVTELASLNNVNANTLKIGDSLMIPVKSGTNPDNMFMYTVKKGDSLYAIAKLYGTTVNEIKKLNYLTSNSLVIGQVLRIPEMYTKLEDLIMPNYINYYVQKGDTLYSIAKKYNISVDDLIKDNSLNSMVLNIGQLIRIRNGTDELLECFGDDYNVSKKGNDEYVVKSGDSLYSIAKRFNTTVSELISLNSLKNSTLSIGQVLQIPNNSSVNYYTVVKGDSLYSIAKRFNVSVDYLKNKNNLITNNLAIGQKLII